MATVDTSSDRLTLGVMSRSLKENERRLALHPDHLAGVPEDLRGRIHVEQGYGERFGLSDSDIGERVGAVRSREQLFAECDVILQPKPLHRDIEEMREGQVFWGWPHCVQDPVLTQLAIDKSLTLIAFEAMNHWNRDGSFNLHVFHANNEMAGYCSVLHAMQLAGTTGDFGPRLSAVVIGFGATARGAVTALTALGVHDVDVLTHREVAAVAAPIHATRLIHFDGARGEDRMSHAATPQGRVPVGEFLAGHDIVVNCVLQNTDAPEMFMDEGDLAHMAPGSLVVDVSCDLGMGFPWARPTTFEDPAFFVGDHVLYYAVDHTPSYLWKSATWENGRALMPFLPTVMGGPSAWDASPTIRRAIEILDGVVQNPAILRFQGRAEEPPHERLTVPV